MVPPNLKLKGKPVRPSTRRSERLVKKRPQEDLGPLQLGRSFTQYRADDRAQLRQNLLLIG